MDRKTRLQGSGKKAHLPILMASLISKNNEGREGKIIGQPLIVLWLKKKSFPSHGGEKNDSFNRLNSKDF